MTTIPLRAGVLVLAATITLAVTVSVAGAAQTDLPPPTSTSPAAGAATGLATLVGVRTGRHARFDRTVFDFTGGTPGYRVEYGTLYEEGRGNPVPLAGAATLRVVFHPANAHDLDTGAPTYDIRRVLDPRLPTLRQIKFGGDFEAVVSAGLGLADRVGFRVFRLQNPYRIVVDVAHQPTQSFGTDTVWVGDATADTIVLGMRAGRHPGYDRLVFDLGTPRVPLVFVAYQPSSTTIVVGFSGRNVPAVVAGPHTIQFGLPQLRSARFAVYENGTASAFVTTASRRGFRVMVLHQPTRLVVDLTY